MFQPTHLKILLSTECFQRVYDEFYPRHIVLYVKAIKYYSENLIEASSFKIQPHNWDGGRQVSMEGVAVNQYKNIYGVKIAST